MTDFPEPGDELTLVLADDAFLDLVGDGAAPAGVSDSVTDMLVAWRAELDALLPTAEALDDSLADTAVLPLIPAKQRPPAKQSPVARLRRQASGVAAIAIGLAASTGVAAAASGPHGPLGGINRVLFGPFHHSAPVDRTALRAQHLLDRAAAAVEDARVAGGITPPARAAIAGTLNVAAHLLRDDTSKQARSLAARLGDLRAALAAVPSYPPSAPPSAQPVPDDHHGQAAQSGKDNHRGSDDGRHGGSGDRGSGDGGSGDGGSTDGRPGSSQSGPAPGSDGGSGPGSGDDGGDRHGGDQRRGGDGSGDRHGGG